MVRASNLKNEPCSFALAVVWAEGVVLLQLVFLGVGEDHIVVWMTRRVDSLAVLTRCVGAFDVFVIEEEYDVFDFGLFGSYIVIWAHDTWLRGQQGLVELAWKQISIVLRRQSTAQILA